MSPKQYTHGESFNERKRLRLTTDQAQVLELAFLIQDPCGTEATQLAAVVLGLLRDRDDVTCLALISEVKYLQAKYPPKHIGGNDESEHSSETNGHKRPHV